MLTSKCKNGQVKTLFLMLGVLWTPEKFSVFEQDDYIHESNTKENN